MTLPRTSVLQRYDSVNLDDVEDERVRHVKSVMVATKLDEDGARDRLEIVREWLGSRFPVVAVSGRTGQGLETLRTAAYENKV